MLFNSFILFFLVLKKRIGKEDCVFIFFPYFLVRLFSSSFNFKEENIVVFFSFPFLGIGKEREEKETMLNRQFFDGGEKSGYNKVSVRVDEN